MKCNFIDEDKYNMFITKHGKNKHDNRRSSSNICAWISESLAYIDVDGWWMVNYVQRVAFCLYTHWVYLSIPLWNMQAWFGKLRIKWIVWYAIIKLKEKRLENV